MKENEPCNEDIDGETLVGNDVNIESSNDTSTRKIYHNDGSRTGNSNINNILRNIAENGKIEKYEKSTLKGDAGINYDDIDGEELEIANVEKGSDDLDGEDLDGEGFNGDDIDGEDLNEEDIDGVDLDREDLDRKEFVDGESDIENLDGEELDGDNLDGEDVDDENLHGETLDEKKTDGKKVESEDLDEENIDGEELERDGYEKKELGETNSGNIGEEDDLDGEALDGENMRIESVVFEQVDEDIDGEDIDGDDIDGEDIDAENDMFGEDIDGQDLDVGGTNDYDTLKLGCENAKTFEFSSTERRKDPNSAMLRKKFAHDKSDKRIHNAQTKNQGICRNSESSDTDDTDVHSELVFPKKMQECSSIDGDSWNEPSEKSEVVKGQSKSTNEEDSLNKTNASILNACSVTGIDGESTRSQSRRKDSDTTEGESLTQFFKEDYNNNRINNFSKHGKEGISLKKSKGLKAKKKKKEEVSVAISVGSRSDNCDEQSLSKGTLHACQLRSESNTFNTKVMSKKYNGDKIGDNEFPAMSHVTLKKENKPSKCISTTKENHLNQDGVRINSEDTQQAARSSKDERNLNEDESFDFDSEEENDEAKFSYWKNKLMEAALSRQKDAIKQSEGHKIETTHRLLENQKEAKKIQKKKEKKKISSKREKGHKTSKATNPLQSHKKKIPKINESSHPNNDGRIVMQDQQIQRHDQICSNIQDDMSHQFNNDKLQISVPALSTIHNGMPQAKSPKKKEKVDKSVDNTHLSNECSDIKHDLIPNISASTKKRKSKEAFPNNQLSENEDEDSTQHPYIGKLVLVAEGKFKGIRGRIIKVETRGWWVLDNPAMKTSKIHSRLCEMIDVVPDHIIQEYYNSLGRRLKRLPSVHRKGANSEKKQDEKSYSMLSEENNEAGTFFRSSAQGNASLDMPRASVVSLNQNGGYDSNQVDFGTESNEINGSSSQSIKLLKQSPGHEKPLSFNQLRKENGERITNIDGSGSSLKVCGNENQTCDVNTKDYLNESFGTVEPPMGTSPSVDNLNAQISLNDSRNEKKVKSDKLSRLNSVKSVKKAAHGSESVRKEMNILVSTNKVKKQRKTKSKQGKSNALPSITLSHIKNNVHPSACESLPQDTAIEIYDRKTGKIIKENDAFSAKELSSKLRTHAEYEPIIQPPTGEKVKLSQSQKRKGRSSVNVRVNPRTEPQIRANSQSTGKKVMVNAGPYKGLVGNVTSYLSVDWVMVSGLPLTNYEIVFNTSQLDDIQELPSHATELTNEISQDIEKATECKDDVTKQLNGIIHENVSIPLRSLELQFDSIKEAKNEIMKELASLDHDASINSNITKRRRILINEKSGDEEGRSTVECILMEMIDKVSLRMSKSVKPSFGCIDEELVRRTQDEIINRLETSNGRTESRIVHCHKKAMLLKSLTNIDLKRKRIEKQLGDQMMFSNAIQKSLMETIEKRRKII